MTIWPCNPRWLCFISLVTFNLQSYSEANWGHHCWGSEGASQNVPSLHVDYFELKAIETLCAQEKHIPLPNYTEEFKLAVFPQMRIISTDAFYLQGKQLTTQPLLFFFSCQLHSPPTCWSPRPPPRPRHIP